MNAVTTTERSALALPEAEMLNVLASSLYPGAKHASIKLVLGYCKAAGLDPMQKPVHIVPMSVKTGEKDGFGNDKRAMRDTVMPGIGLYRTQASRTGQYAGQDRPTYGPMVSFTFKKKFTEWRSVTGSDKKRPFDHFEDETIEYPEWCEVTVYRIVDGVRCAFTAQEWWLENYATAGRDTDAPNEMWETRIRGQLKKCTEAQALRMAFPDAVGAQPTAEEMEGRAVDSHVVVEASTGEVTGAPLTPQRKSDVERAEDVAFTEKPAATAAAATGATATATSAGTINPGQVKYITQKLAAAGLEGEAVAQFLKKHGAAALDQTITLDQFDTMKSELLAAL